MYLPYLRGKQYELIALRELIPEIAASGNVSPIIEPVRLTTSTIERALDLFVEMNVNFTLIINPTVGELVGRTSRIIELVKKKLGGYKNYQLGIIIDNDDSLGQVIESIKANDLGNDFSYSLIHNYIPAKKDALKSFLKIYTTRFNVINYNKIGSRRYHREFDSATIVSLEDKFISKDKNSDYALTPDEFFSEEHLFYTQDGFVGFSDFLTIGEPYSESGFLPYAVAIHITYPDADKKLRIHHFVSDSNEDTVDVPGKFDEALNKLIDFINEKHLNTKACIEFRKLFTEEHYPGLGSLKKLSTMNHIELIIELLK